VRHLSCQSNYANVTITGHWLSQKSVKYADIHSIYRALRVAGAVTFSCPHVVPRLTKFLETHPGLTVDVLLDERPLDLIAEGVDAALRPGTLRDSSTLTARKLASAPRHVWGTPSRLFRPLWGPGYAGRANPAPNSHRIGEAETSGASARVITRLGQCNGAGSGQRRRRHAGRRAGDMGLAISSVWMFSRELASGAVQPVLADWFLPPLDLWAVYPTGRMPSVKARTFAAFVEAELKAGDFRL
jgi:DNA-binding transcriptional LysR family regulator